MSRLFKSHQALVWKMATSGTLLGEMWQQTKHFVGKLLAEEWPWALCFTLSVMDL